MNHPAVNDLATVSDPPDPPRSNHRIIFKKRFHEFLERIVLEDRIGVNAQHMCELRCIDANVECVSLSPILFVDDNEVLIRNLPRPVNPPDRLSWYVLNIIALRGEQFELPDNAVKSAIF